VLLFLLGKKYRTEYFFRHLTAKEEKMPLEALAFVKAEWAKQLWNKLDRLRGEEAKELDRLRDEFVDPNVLKDVYVVPHLQDRNPADSRQDDLLIAARQSAFERINEFFQGKLPLEKDGRHQMFILSDAGMGKTSFLLMLKLMHLTSFWPQKYSCQLFKLGDETLQQVRDLPNKGETFLLLDALDEDRQAWKRIRERLLELLQASEDFRRVIISSRTQFFPEMETDSLGRPEIKVLSGYHCPVLYLSPFSNEQVQEFIEKKLPLTLQHRLLFQAKKIQQRQQRANHLLEQMQDLRMRPMLLHHLDKLLEAEKSQQGWNAYTVYQALINEWLDREVRKLRAHHCCGRMPERKELFHACVRIAEWMQRRGERIISEEELQQLILADQNVSWLEEFELGGRSLLNRNSERAFRFSHYTIQEFLVAYGMINNALAASQPVRPTDQLLRFLELSNGMVAWHLLDMTDADFVSRYVEKYWLLKDKIQNNDSAPTMIRLPRGCFLMGDIQGIGDSDEVPVHELALDSFAISRYPITFFKYDAFCIATGRPGSGDNGWGRGHRPVINISWQDANIYCQWLSKETGHTYRLPTEAEWEYACRAGSSFSYCFGDEKEQLDDYAWHDGNSDGTTQTVGQKKCNAWGLHDMHGNVWEWCIDWYQGFFYAVSPVRNPIHTEPGLYRVVRGGSWGDKAQDCRSSCRKRYEPYVHFGNIGFRVVRVLEKDDM
jgi:formylglycine-generating enzyme required for sulfatase activity